MNFLTFLKPSAKIKSFLPYLKTKETAPQALSTELTKSELDTLNPSLPEHIKKNFLIWHQQQDYFFCYQMLNNGLKAPESISDLITTNVLQQIKNNKSSILQLVSEHTEPDKNLLHLWASKHYFSLFYVKDKNKTNENELLALSKTIVPDEFYNYSINAIEKSLTLLCENIVPKKETVVYTIDNKKIKFKQLNADHPVFTEHRIIITNTARNLQEYIERNTKEFSLEQITSYLSLLNNIVEQARLINKTHNFWKGLNDSLLWPIPDILANNHFKKTIRDTFKKSRNDTIKQLQTINLDEHIAQVSQQQYTSSIHIDQLPANSREIIKTITDIYSSLISTKELSPEHSFQVNNLFKTKLSQVIVKYLTIDPEYRTTLKTANGSTPVDLLNESLENIRLSFVKMQDIKNETSLHRLQAANNHIKTINKTI